ncbi:MAG: mechanosensitive ion channel domain-containing protein, partial [Verrucomicrobiota bacterium]
EVGGDTPSDLEKQRAIAEYQRQISERIFVAEEQKAQLSRLLDSQRELDHALSTQLQRIQAGASLARQVQVLAFELKRRVGLGQLQGDAVPSGIAQAIQPDTLEDLTRREKETARRLDVSRNIAAELQETKDVSRTQEVLMTIQEIVRDRLALLDDMEKLTSSLNIGVNDLSEGELKALRQRAHRRFRSEVRTRTLFDTSEEAKTLSDLLSSLFVDLLKLEEQENIVGQLEQKNGELIELAQGELSTLETILPLLVEQMNVYGKQKDRVLSTVRMALKPETAGDIADGYQERTGETLQIPEPLENKDQKPAVHLAAEQAYELHVRSEAAQRWVEFFVERQGKGVEKEIEAYQARQGEYETRKLSIQRRLHLLAGHPTDMAPTSADGTSLADEMEVLQFQSGEIGVAAHELGRARSRDAWSIVFQTGGILFGAWLVTAGIGTVLQWLQSRTDETQAQVSYLLSAVRAISKFVIWVIAMMMVLNALGFNIGAILAGLGIGGLAIGLAAQKTLADILGGIILMIEGPFRVGDVIKVNDLGLRKVTGISWRATRLETPFGQVTFIPNNQVSDATIINCTRRNPAIDWMEVYVDVEHDPEQVADILQEVLRNCEKTQEPNGVWVTGVEFFEERQMVCYWPWWETTDFFKREEAIHELWALVLQRFQREGILGAHRRSPDTNGPVPKPLMESS